MAKITLTKWERLEKQAKKWPILPQISSATGIEIGYLVLVPAGMFVIWVYLNFAWYYKLMTLLIGAAYPMWESIKALRSPSLEDDKYWLTYWVVYGSFQAMDYWIEDILYYVPFYKLAKLLFIIFLVNPTMPGSLIIHDRYIRPLTEAYEKGENQPKQEKQKNK